MNDETQIRDLIARWHAATAAGDIDTLRTLMAGDVVFLVAGQPPMRGREAFADALAALLVTHSIASSGEIRELVVEGGLAYCWNALEVRVTPRAGGATMRRAGNVLSIYRREAGSWVLARDANLLALQTDA
ncbi:SgcJ/EcaC family oxidoreductase [Paraburkholderia sp. Ac-20347]|uniref:YybH family protein n=1 Tax=Paraburkholderia sp. Ac-20347 TaxID=2703892 RepID=UPI00197F492B|nr:SgcJ/EcaC family oxidoreductase [Paraburkholderia sp. Ac-20347]MBN3810821.1 SgcJ/EcaC family oxidoreductase [Paraburkholderia sp. Ac-20347]